MGKRHFLTVMIFAQLTLLAPMPGFSQGALPELAAPETVSGWRMGAFNVFDADQRDVPASERVVEYTGAMAWTVNSEAPGLLLTCNEQGNLSATFSLAPVDFGDPAFTRAKSRFKALRGRLVINGESPALKEKFLLRRKLSVAHAMSREAGYAVIDAIYAKKSVRLEVDGKDAVDYDLPAVDAELEAFVAGCPAFKADGE